MRFSAQRESRRDLYRLYRPCSAACRSPNLAKECVEQAPPSETPSLPWDLQGDLTKTQHIEHSRASVTTGWLSRDEDNGEDRPWWRIEHCPCQTRYGTTCKALKQCWSYISEERCLWYFKDHLDRSGNHSDMSTGDVLNAVDHAQVNNLKTEIDTYDQRERERVKEEIKAEKNMQLAVPKRRPAPPDVPPAPSGNNRLANAAGLTDGEIPVKREAIIDLRDNLVICGKQLQNGIVFLTKVKDAFEEQIGCLNAAKGVMDEMLMRESFSHSSSALSSS